MASPTMDTSNLPKIPTDTLGEVKGPLIPPAKKAVESKEPISLLDALKTPGARLFVMTYASGVSREAQRAFVFIGDQKAAKARAELHCVKMGFRFKYITPFVFDLDYSEALREQALSNGDNGPQIY